MSRDPAVLIVGSAPTGGDFEHYARLIRETDVLIAADGGVRACREAQRVPDVCVGDFDSTDSETLEWARLSGAEIRRFPTAKDESDLDLALAVARERGACAVTFTAAFSGRLDHTLAALGTLLSAADLGAAAEEPSWRAYPLSAESRDVITLCEPPGTVLSLLAVDGCAVASITGVEYPLEHGLVPSISSLGLSNVASSDVQRVKLHSGSALVIVNVSR